MKVVVGLVGEKGSGKGTFVDYLRGVSNKRVDRIGFSTVLVKTLELWGIEINRENLQKLSPAMVDTYGDATLAHAVARDISQSTASLVVADGIRWDADIEMLRSFPSNVLVYVTADPRVRWGRTRLRGEKVDESETSFEQFMEEERTRSELSIPKIGRTADFTIFNNDSVDRFEKQVVQFYARYLTDLL